jgi:periplasmic protein TonB
VFQTASPVRFSVLSVTASLLLHCAGILLLCLVSFAVSPLRLSDRQLLSPVALLAPTLDDPERVTPRPAPKPPPRIIPPRITPSKLIPPQRRFEAASPQAPELHLKPVIDLPPAPVIDPVRAPMPEPALAAELPRFRSTPPPPAVKIGAFDITQPHPAQTVPLPPGPHVSIKGAGFASAENAGANISPRRLTAIGGFGNASVAAATAPSKLAARPPAASASGTTIPAEILDKPRPAYTDEARRLDIEGEVLLEVTFEASGETKVLQVLRGLGHGLDESAMDAARRIHFRPAQRDGAAIDSSAIVHIIFQLAY